MAHSRPLGNGHYWGMYVALAVTSWGRPRQGWELLPLGVVAFNCVFKPRGNKREAQPAPDPVSPARRTEDACYLSLGGLHVPLSGQACQEPPGAQASWLGVPLADSQRGRERAHNLISVFVPDTNPNSSGCPNTPSIVSFLSGLQQLRPTPGLGPAEGVGGDLRVHVGAVAPTFPPF